MSWVEYIEFPIANHSKKGWSRAASHHNMD